MNRRAFLFSAAFAGAGLFAWKLMGNLRASEAGAAASPAKPKTIKIEEFTDAGVSKGVTPTQTLVLTDEEWKQKLTPDSYEVTRRRGTERAFTGQYDHFYEKGIYRCICCDTALYSSVTKFNSGTGWPSFWAPIEGAIGTSEDRSFFFLVRTEVHCHRCGGHLGHVFNDGPQPTGLRYCMNGAALKFVPA